MANLSGRAVFTLVQVLNEKIVRLEKEIELLSPDDEQLADLEDELLSYSLAEEELRTAYEEFLKIAGNYPPYEELVKRDKAQFIGRNRG
jgi:hypothetical protein